MEPVVIVIAIVVICIIIYIVHSGTSASTSASACSTYNCVNGCTNNPTTGAFVACMNQTCSASCVNDCNFDKTGAATCKNGVCPPYTGWQTTTPPPSYDSTTGDCSYPVVNELCLAYNCVKGCTNNPTTGAFVACT